MPDAGAPIFLVGFMASGKTTVGSRLAARLGWAFVDLDALVVEGAGAPVADIFAREGETGFRRRDSAAVRHAARMRQTVVATGGGAACREENLSVMLGEGRVIALVVSPEEAVRRAGHRRDARSSIGPRIPGAARDLLQVRDPFYARAHVRIDTDGQTPDQIVEAALAALRLPRPGSAA